MSRRLFQLAIVLCTIGLTHAARAEDRTVTFAVHAVANGAALPPGLVAAVDVAGKQFAAQFGPDAIATVQAIVPEGAQEVFASLPVVLGQRTVVPGMNGRDEYYQAVRDVSRRYCLPRPVRVVLAPGQANYSVQLTLAPAITVTGRGVDASGRGRIEFDVESMGKPYTPRVSSTEKFELTGVRQGVSTWIGFGAYNGINDEIKIVKLTAAQTATDLDLGSVVIDPRTPGATVSLTAHNRPPPRADQENHDRALTLVSDYGGRAYVFGIDAAGHVAAVPTDTSVEVVAGGYYIVPGAFSGSLTAKVLQLIQARRHKELDTSGKLITILPGDNPAVAVDVTALINGLTNLAIAPTAEGRTVTFAVHAASNGAALPPGLVAAVDVEGEQFAARFGPDATATVQAVVPEGAQEAYVSVPVALGQRTSVPGMNGRDEYYRAVWEARERFCLPRPTRVALTAGQTSVAVELTLAAAITVSGRGVDATGQGRKEFNVECLGQPLTLRPRKTDRFELHGVRKGMATWIGFTAFNGTNREMKIIKLTAVQTAADLDLGDVVISPTTPDATVTMTAQNRPPHRPDERSQDLALTLVSEDGQRAYIFGVDEAGHIAAVPTETSVKVVAGTYHLVPGGFGGTLTANVLQLIESGRGKELAANGKKITLVPGENPAVVVDVTALVKGLTSADSPP